MVQPRVAADGTDAGVTAMQTEQGEGRELIAGPDMLEAFRSLPDDQRAPLDAQCRGVLAETALTGRQRYEWRLLVPLLHSLVDSVLAAYRQQEEEAGPPRPPPPGFDSMDDLVAHLHRLLDSHEQAPFTLQRLCEVLLEPRKQYARLDKVALAIEKLLMVTSTRRPDSNLPPPPTLASLRGVNDNPPSPYLDGRPPQVLDQQQHQALLQQQQQAMATAQQQQQGLTLGTLPNGIDNGPLALDSSSSSGSQPAAAVAAAGVPAAAAPEAMQLDTTPVSPLMQQQPGTTAAAAAAAAAAEQQQHAAVPATPPPVSPAEAASAAQFVESALIDTASPSAAPSQPDGSSSSSKEGAGTDWSQPSGAAAAAAAGEGESDGEGAAGAAAASVLPSPPAVQHQPAQQGPGDMLLETPVAAEAGLPAAAAAAEGATAMEGVRSEGAPEQPGPTLSAAAAVGPPASTDADAPTDEGISLGGVKADKALIAPETAAAAEPLRQ